MAIFSHSVKCYHGQKNKGRATLQNSILLNILLQYFSLIETETLDLSRLLYSQTFAL